MKRLLLLSVLLAASTSICAGELLEPADYLRLLIDSKLRYNLVSEPAKAPMKTLHCPRRDATTRVVASGSGKKLVDWKTTPEVAKLIDEAEPLFQAKQYDEAARLYLRALELDPEAVVARFSYGDTLLWGKRDAAAALAEYKKGIALDPTLPLGYFFSSTASMHLGRVADAREWAVKALALHPAYDAIWEIAQKNPRVYGIRPIVRHPFDPPEGLVGEKGKNGIDVWSGPNGAWLGYATCKATWANEKRFAKQHPAEGVSQDEERACVYNQLSGAYNAASSKLEEQAKQRGNAKPDIAEADVVAAMPPLERHLYEVAKAKLFDGYILFEIIGQRCPVAMSLIGDEDRKQVEDYIRRYIMVPEAEGQSAELRAILSR